MNSRPHEIILYDSSWSGVQGKLLFGYTAKGWRYMKKFIKPSGDTVATYYVRDPKGNVIAVYEAHQTASGDTMWLKELTLFGSERVGVFKANVRVCCHPLDTCPVVCLPLPGLDTVVCIRRCGGGRPIPASVPSIIADSPANRLYELKDHLGNVRVVVSGQKIPVDTNGDGLADYFKANVVSVTDYYPFGWQIAGRSYWRERYRYGFNSGSETEWELGEGTHSYTFYRVADWRVGRWWSVDPKLEKYYAWSPYQYGKLSPVGVVDKDGGDYEVHVDHNARQITIRAVFFVPSGDERLLEAAQLAAAMIASQLQRYRWVVEGDEGTAYYTIRADLQVRVMNDLVSQIRETGNDPVSQIRALAVERAIEMRRQYEAGQLDFPANFIIQHPVLLSVLIKAGSLPPNAGAYTFRGYEIVLGEIVNSLIVAHEMGHTLGLSHQEGTLMHPITDVKLTGVLGAYKLMANQVKDVIELARYAAMRGGRVKLTRDEVPEMGPSEIVISYSEVGRAPVTFWSGKVEGKKRRIGNPRF